MRFPDMSEEEQNETAVALCEGRQVEVLLRAPTVFFAMAEPWEAGRAKFLEQRFVFNGDAYRLGVRARPVATGPWGDNLSDPRDLEVTLEMGKTRQTLFAGLPQIEESFWSNPEFRLFWVGDLDEDGRLDLLFQAPAPSSDRYSLFLSCLATGTEIVGKVELVPAEESEDPAVGSPDPSISSASASSTPNASASATPGASDTGTTLLPASGSARVEGEGMVRDPGSGSIRPPVSGLGTGTSDGRP